MTTRKDPLTGQPVNIFVYSLKHGGGICYLYVNETTNRTLEECMKFQLKGLKIEGYKNQNEINIRVGPGKTKFIELKATCSNW